MTPEPLETSSEENRPQTTIADGSGELFPKPPSRGGRKFWKSWISILYSIYFP